MVMVVEGGAGGCRGVQGGGLGHGILRTFMRDESGGGKKITPIKIITERGGGFESMQRKN